MRFQLAFLFSSYLLIFLGLVSLFFTQEISIPYLVLAGAGLVFGAWREARGAREWLSTTIQNLVLVAVFVHALLAIFVFKELPLLALAQFLLALQAVKLISPKKGRDWSLLYLLSFFSVVSASALSVEMFFAAVFVSYLFVAPWVLVLFQLKEGTEAAGKDPDKEARLLAWSLFRLVAGINIILLLLTLILFMSFPRFGVGLLGDVWATGSAVVGFSDRLALGEVSKIQKNGAVAMRVSFDQPRPQLDRELYWRGVALDQFDGRKWQKSNTEAVALRRVGEAYRVSEPVNRRAPLIHQKIILEPTGSPALFALNRPLLVSGRLGYLFLDSFGNLFTIQPFPFQISYEVFSHPDAPRGDAPPSAAFLQLPSLEPRILSLARQLTEGIADEGQKARVLERYLKQTYRYSLEDLPVGGTDPLAAFLFEVKQGNCEYFASSLAIMLRILGIPTRVVNGYLGGEWNPYGEYLLIRQTNAHSWVEAYIGEEGWVTLDPTPSVAGGRTRMLFSSLTQFADFLRLNWYRYVINFGLADQYQLFAVLQRPHQWFGKSARTFSLSELTARLRAGSRNWVDLAIFIGVLVLGWAGLRKIRSTTKASSRNSPHQATERYRRFLKLCAKKGFQKKPAETPDEFSRRVSVQGNGLVGEFTSLYQQARFSSVKDLTAGIKKMDQLLMDLRKNRRAAELPF